MAEPLKTFFSPVMVRALANEIRAVHVAFDTKKFVADATRDLESLELIGRAKAIARALRAHLPERYLTALDILLRSLGEKRHSDALGETAMGPFFYFPHVLFVAEYGLQDFDASLAAQCELTKRFTAEFSIRHYISADPERAFAQLHIWAKDENPHVRRLASEGTRLRLPWAIRVPWLDQNPKRVLEVLEVLKDDSSPYVRRSVANSLNDMGKVHAALLFTTAKRWLVDASAERRALLEHALRGAVKRAEPQALMLLGFGGKPKVTVEDAKFSPAKVSIGDNVVISFSLTTAARVAQSLLVDIRVHFVKGSGKTSPKVFKLKRIELAPSETIHLSRKVSLAVHTTRKPFPGEHAVEILVNGALFPLGTFMVRASAK